MFQCVNVAKAYGGQTLFTDLTWLVNTGDRIGLVGPNGAGKTTLLRLLIGATEPDHGQIIRPRHASVGYLPQEMHRPHAGTIFDYVRSGRSDLVALEEQLHQIEAQLAAPHVPHAATLAAQLDELTHRYEALGGRTLTTRAHAILTGLGVPAQQHQAQLTSLSGGWAMRVNLARLLVMQPDLLLLDEPTNHLDLTTLAWLEAFLRNYPGAWVVVSHDRYFLNQVATSIAELSADGLHTFSGNYDDYLAARAQLEEQYLAQEREHSKRVAHIQAFITRFQAQATKARQAQSRIKLLARLQSAAPPHTLRPQQHKTFAFALTDPPRSGRDILALHGVHKNYGVHTVYRNLEFTLHRGEKVALVGDNGAGKSTLLKLLAGAVSPDAGARSVGHNVHLYYFAQHQSDALNPHNTVLAELRTVMPNDSEARVRSLLGAFLFPGDAVEKRVATLSGGEKSRLALAKMLAQPTNLLLLDEPTNHLDLNSRNVLEDALAAYPATMVFVSHDRYFINRLATRVVDITAGGGVTDYPGNYDYFQWKKAQPAAAAPTVERGFQKAAPAEAAPPKSDAALAYHTRKAQGREAAKRLKLIAQLEEEIASAEQSLAAIDARLCDHNIASDPAQCQLLASQRAENEKQRDELYARWEALVS